MIQRMRMLVLVVALLVISAPVDAAVLCANPGGSVSVRAACKASERRLDPVALGLQGPPGVSGYEIVSREFDSTASVSNVIIQFGFDAACPAGKKVLGGGGNGSWVDSASAQQTAAVVSSHPVVINDAHAWVILVQKPSGAFFLEDERVLGTVFAICANAR